jgi:hypothetical protein
MNTSVTPAVPYCKTYANIAALTSTGVLLVENADLHVKGQLTGKITLGCVGTGNVWIDSSVTYNTQPTLRGDGSLDFGAVPDMLGIVADNYVYVTDPGSSGGNHACCPGTDANREIDAAIFSRLNGFQAENYNSRSVETLTIKGSLQQNTRGAVGTSDSHGNIVSGFHKNYNFDDRFMTSTPYGYPATTQFSITNWSEDTKIPSDFWNDIPMQ